MYDAHPEGAPEKLQVEELIHFQVIAGHYATLRKMDKMLMDEKMAIRATQAIASAILDRSASWTNVREKMSFQKLPPIPFKT